MTAEQQLSSLKDFIEWTQTQSEVEIQMYVKDNGELWKDSDTLIACCRARSGLCDVILEKMERLRR